MNTSLCESSSDHGLRCESHNVVDLKTKEKKTEIK